MRKGGYNPGKRSLIIACFYLVLLVSLPFVGCGPSLSQIKDWQDTKAVDPLIAALKNKDSDVRWQAAEALGRLKDPRATKPLISTMKYENEDLYVIDVAA